MSPTQLLAELANATELPIRALRQANTDRVALVPVFLDQIDLYLANPAQRTQPTPLFFVFHLLGSWNEKSAYPHLARLLRSSSDDLYLVLGDAITVTSHRVMVAVFDGNPGHLHQIILDPQADDFVRWHMLDALTILTLQGRIPRDDTETFVRSCFMDLQPQTDCVAWVGWQNAVAMLGLTEIKLLVKLAFDRGSIAARWMTYSHFVDDLNKTLEGKSAALSQYVPFGDTIEELSMWTSFR